MKQYSIIIGGLILFFLTIFVIVESLNLPLLTDPSGWMETSTVGAALVGVVLLVSDIFLPVPSTFVMIANGALFGIVLGTVLSTVGSVGAALTGFFIGRRSDSLFSKLVSGGERERANRLLRKWGAIAIIITRPIPLLAETTAIVAGTSTISWQSATLASFIGSLPPALVYAFTGATAANFNNAVLSFGLVLLVAGLFWLVSQKLQVFISLRTQKGESEKENGKYRQ